jgi:hypothetical protein
VLGTTGTHGVAETTGSDFFMSTIGSFLTTEEDDLVGIEQTNIYPTTIKSIPKIIEQNYRKIL